MKSQTKLIKAYLEKGKSITPMKALDKFKCFRLAARVKDLRNVGMDIITDKITKNGKCFASYRLKAQS